MKRILWITALCGLFSGLQAQNQTFYDALIGSQQEVNGTARFMAVGGAMGALGGDASTVSFNPAGIGVYRSSEITITGNLHWTNTSMGQLSPTNHINANLSNVAYIGTWLNPDNKGLVTFNFGVTYNRLKNFSREGRYSGESNGSLSQFMAQETNGVDPANFSDPIYAQFENEQLSWRSVLGYEAGLFSAVGNTNLYISHYAQNVLQTGLTNTYHHIHFGEYGSNNEFGLSFGGNVENVLYWGMSFNCDYLFYNKQTAYQESMQDNKSFTLNTNYQMEGCGFSYKVGVIVKPVNWLRIGAAFHTPTWYKLEEWASASISYENDKGHNKTNETPVSNGYFYLQSPLSAIGSVGFVLGKYGFIGFDYQFSNDPYLELEDAYGNLKYEMNDAAKQNLTYKHAFRLGMEFKPINDLALRIGGGYTLPSMQANAERPYYYNDVRCDTDYYNTKDSYNVTAGIGYRIDRHAIDLAYVWQVNNADYVSYQGADPIGMRSVRNQIVLTYGVRF